MRSLVSVLTLAWNCGMHRPMGTISHHARPVPSCWSQSPRGGRPMGVRRRAAIPHARRCTAAARPKSTAFCQGVPLSMQRLQSENGGRRTKVWSPAGGVPVSRCHALYTPPHRRSTTIAMWHAWRWAMLHSRCTGRRRRRRRIALCLYVCMYGYVCRCVPANRPVGSGLLRCARVRPRPIATSSRYTRAYDDFISHPSPRRSRRHCGSAASRASSGPPGRQDPVALRRATTNSPLPHESFTPCPFCLRCAASQPASQPASLPACLGAPALRGAAGCEVR